MTQVLNDVGLFLVKLIAQNGFGDRVHVSIGPSEVILSFCDGQNRANVHFLGKGHYDYAYTKDGVFVAGEQEGDLTQNINPDLLNYLNTMIFPKEKTLTTWQPIETAPKDGTEILGWVGDSKNEGRCVLMSYKTTQRYCDWDRAWKTSEHWWAGNTTCKPTHWLPLPVCPWQNITP